CRRGTDRFSSLLELGQFGKGMARRRTPVGPCSATPAPPPGAVGAGETDLIHQSSERLFTKADAGRERLVDRLIAAGRADFAGVAGEAVGKVDAEPFAAEAAVGERGPARVGFPTQSRRSRRGQR